MNPKHFLVAGVVAGIGVGVANLVIPPALGMLKKPDGTSLIPDWARGATAAFGAGLVVVLTLAFIPHGGKV